MKATKIISIFIIAFFSVLVINSCGLAKTTGDINVTCTVLAGETLDLSGISIQVHGVSTFNNLLFSETGSGSSTSVSASFVDLEEGKYYVCAWADNDADMTFSSGDFVGWYPYPVNILPKDEMEIPIEVYVED